jgi:cupin 2 domain-containing protein
MIKPLNLYANLPESTSGEIFDTLLEAGGVKIERIISHSAASPKDFWFDQDKDEWVLVLRGESTLQFHPDEIVHLKPGDHLLIPKHCRHRVEGTSVETIWLAVHLTTHSSQAGIPSGEASH